MQSLWMDGILPYLKVIPASTKDHFRGGYMNDFQSAGEQLFQFMQRTALRYLLLTKFLGKLPISDYHNNFLWEGYIVVSDTSDLESDFMMNWQWVSADGLFVEACKYT